MASGVIPCSLANKVEFKGYLVGNKTLNDVTKLLERSDTIYREELAYRSRPSSTERAHLHLHTSLPPAEFGPSSS